MLGSVKASGDLHRIIMYQAIETTALLFPGRNVGVTVVWPWKNVICYKAFCREFGAGLVTPSLTEREWARVTKVTLPCYVTRWRKCRL